MSNASEWIYYNNDDNTVRYALGTKGEKTLFCFGINPSVATPEKPDPTIRKVESIAKHNGYDSFIMFNVYPKRDTNFEQLSERLNDTEHIKNIEIISKIIAQHPQLDIWVAFGNYIHKRKYLPICFKDIFAKLPNKKIRWLTTGTNKNGSPKHPLYQKNTAVLIEFDMVKYIKTL